MCHVYQGECLLAAMKSAIVCSYISFSVRELWNSHTPPRSTLLLSLLFSYTPNEHKLKFVVGVVLSSPVIQSSQPIEAESVQTTESTGVVESSVSMPTEEVSSESNHVTEMTQSAAVNNGAALESGATSGAFLATSTPMGRSSRYVLISDISRSRLIRN